MEREESNMFVSRGHTKIVFFLISNTMGRREGVWVGWEGEGEEGGGLLRSTLVSVR